MATDFALADAGAVSIDFTQTSGAAPGINLTIYVDGVWKGNLVHEPLFADWWINKTIPGLPAGPNPSYQLAYGTLDQVVAAYPRQRRARPRGRVLAGVRGDRRRRDPLDHRRLRHARLLAGPDRHARRRRRPRPPASTTTATPSPTPTPVPPKSTADLVPGAEGKATITGDLVPGGEILVTVPGHAGEQVEIVVFSTPRSLGVHTLSAQATATATLPADLAVGDHRVAAYATDGTLIAWAPVTVSSDVLAATGVDPTPLGLGGAIALLAGAAMVLVSRPSRPSVARRRR